ncbi:MAG: ABC transporter ATP-binding protein [Bradymonadia bacterium]
MSAPFIEVSGVSKLFGHIRALNEVSFTLGAGTFGLLGPNGSGKSTLMKLVCGQLNPDTGAVKVLGLDPFERPEIFRALGLCPEQDRFYEDMTGVQFVTALCRLQGVGARDARKMAERALERVGMSAHGKKQLRAMSRGMRQRIKIAQAVAHDPQVVLLDEPLTGADPVARADLIKLVQSLGAEGRCVLVSSHVLHEVEAMTHQVLLLREGRLRAQGDIFKLRRLLTDRPYRIQVEVADPRRLAARLLNADIFTSVTLLGDDAMELTTVDLDAAVSALPEAAAALGVTVKRLSSPDADLESVYRYLIR